MRRTREIWVGIVRQYEQSGQTQVEFAEARSIPVGTLRSWIYRLRDESDGAEEPDVPVLPVRVVRSTAPVARRWGEGEAVIEVELGEEIRLRFPAGTPVAVIGDLVAALRQRC